MLAWSSWERAASSSPTFLAVNKQHGLQELLAAIVRPWWWGDGIRMKPAQLLTEQKSAFCGCPTSGLPVLWNNRSHDCSSKAGREFLLPEEVHPSCSSEFSNIG